MKKKIDPIEALLDPNNNENIVLYNDKDEPVEFEQIAVIPLDDHTYVILQPVKLVGNMKEDEAFAFEIIENEDEHHLQLVEDDALIDRIFDDYKDLYNSQRV